MILAEGLDCEPGLLDRAILLVHGVGHSPDAIFDRFRAPHGLHERLVFFIPLVE